MDKIVKVVTARGTDFMVGEWVKEITYSAGDPAIGAPNTYYVSTSGHIIAISDVVEVWTVEVEGTTPPDPDEELERQWEKEAREQEFEVFGDEAF